MRNKILTVCLMAIFVLFSVSIFAAGKGRFGIEAGYFYQSDSDFRDIYGSGGLAFGANAGFMATKNIEISAAFDLYGASGTTLVSNEDIEISLASLRFGGYYHFKLRGVTPKIGAGLAMTWVSEETPFGDFDDSGMGWFAGAGVEVPAAKNIIAGLDLIYNDVSIEGDFGDESVGGFSVLVTAKIEL